MKAYAATASLQAPLNHSQQPRQPQRHGRDVRHQYKEDQHRDEPGPYGDGQLGDAHPRDPGGDVEVEPDWRVTEPDLHVDRHQYPEMHWVDAETHGHWK